MTLKKYNPTTPSQRGLTLVDYSGLWKGKPFKKLTSGKKSTGGRSHGRITMRHRGGGHKRLYREIDFKRVHSDVQVERIEYDPNRGAFIALVKNFDTDQHSYIIAPNEVSVGDRLSSGTSAEIKVGNTLQLKNAPIGLSVHNIELKIGKPKSLRNRLFCRVFESAEAFLRTDMR